MVLLNLERLKYLPERAIRSYDFLVIVLCNVVVGYQHFRETMPVSWARNMGTLNSSLGKQMRLSSILTTWTERKVSPWARLGSYSFEPWL